MMIQRLFVGYPISLDLRMRLNVSKAWRDSRLNIALSSEDPIEVKHQEVIYLGFFMKTPFVPLNEIEETASKINKALSEYASDYSPDLSHICCFAQTFVQ